MVRSNFLKFIAGAVALGLIAFARHWQLNDHPPIELSTAQSASVTSRPKDLSTRPAEATTARGAARVIAAETSEPSSTDLRSLDTMTKTLEVLARPNTAVSELVHVLENEKERPMVVREANPETGDLTIVRTNAPLWGTRYFHAQYFSDGKGRDLIQHASFEFRAGATAMADAQAAVRAAFPQLGEPVEKHADFAKWNMYDGHVLWVKKLGLEDLQDHPYNAYQPGDVGTIRVALEVEIHDAEAENESK